MSDLAPTSPTASPALLPYRHGCPADADPFAPRLPGSDPADDGGHGVDGGVGILLMAYGGPASLDEVPAYYTDIRGGRPPSQELLDELLERYEAIGGRSPLAEVTERQRRALEGELARRGLPVPVHVGYKHSPPFVAETVGRMADEGVRRILALALAPHFSTMTACSYCQRVDAARRTLQERDGGPAVRYAMVADWHAEPAFIEALADVTRTALATLSGDGRPWVVFSAHSLPERIVGLGDPYPDLLRETARLVAETLGLSGWSFAFQSAARTGDAWLGPDLSTELERLAAAGVRSVVVSSVGFVASNLELLYDIDIEARARAAELGMRLVRAAALDDHPRLVAALADIVERALRRGRRSSTARASSGAA
ncbi:MAG: ferrochelatase [Chloroflexota bacterium]|nr:MAG: ferrochelatase [Chloroflexota bacterium]